MSSNLSSCVNIGSNVFLFMVQFLYVLWTVMWMVVDLGVLMGIRSSKRFGLLLYRSFSFSSSIGYYTLLLQQLRKAVSYPEWLTIATAIDEVRGSTLWRQENTSDEHYDVPLIEGSLQMLRTLRHQLYRPNYYPSSTTPISTPNTPSTSIPIDPLDSLFFHLSPMVTRNFGGIENSSLYQYSLLGTKVLIEKFLKEIIRCLDLLVTTLPVLPNENKHIRHGTATVTPSTVHEPPVPEPSISSPPSSPSSVSSYLSQYHILQQRIAYVDKLRLQLGRTSLALSGGGAFSLAHLGVVRTLLENGLLPKVISGTSGGSLIAALMGIHSDEVLIKHILVPEIILHDYYQPKIGIVPSNPPASSLSTLLPSSETPTPIPTTTPTTTTPIFDSFTTQFYRFLYTSIFSTYPYVMNPELFMHSLKIYLQDITFEEAFQRTGRIINIPVVASIRNRVRTVLDARSTLGSAPGIPPPPPSSSSFASTYQHQHTFVLNYLTAPHVLLRSAVAASCALPGLLPPTVLQAKNKYGHIVNYHTVGVQTIDGSMQMDIPFQEMAMLFHVRNVIVSQCNPHITLFLSSSKHENYTVVSPYTFGTPVPFSRTPALSSIGQHSLLYRSLTLMEDWLRQDILNRTKSLAYLRLLPKWFGGWDMHGIFLQKYTGNITIIPRQPFLSLWKAFKQPTLKDMENYIIHGSRATYPHLATIRSMVAIESKLAECSRKLHQRLDNVTVRLQAWKDTRSTTTGTDTPTSSSIVPTTMATTGSWSTDPLSALPATTVPPYPSPSTLTEYSYSQKGFIPTYPNGTLPSTTTNLTNISLPPSLPSSSSSTYVPTTYSISSTVEPMRVVSYSIPKNLSGGMEAYFTNPYFTSDHDDEEEEEANGTVATTLPSLGSTKGTVSPSDNVRKNDPGFFEVAELPVLTSLPTTVPLPSSLSTTVTNVPLTPTPVTAPTVQPHSISSTPTTVRPMTPRTLPSL